MSSRKTPSFLLLTLMLSGLWLSFPNHAAGDCPTFQPLTPCVVLDTRLPIGPNGGPPIATGTPRIVTLSGTCGIPAGTNIVAVALEATSFRSTGSGPFVLTLTEPPAIPAFSPRTRMNCPAGVCTHFAVPALDADSLRIAVTGGGSAHVILSVCGYFYFP